MKKGQVVGKPAGDQQGSGRTHVSVGEGAAPGSELPQGFAGAGCYLHPGALPGGCFASWGVLPELLVLVLMPWHAGPCSSWETRCVRRSTTCRCAGPAPVSIRSFLTAFSDTASACEPFSGF
ncbi:hypothetical protein HJG60_011680 [Phyllostomus discolor]|uniref:Uncharacterized protein n=1 Tax=Phyllostomus discolor TaxID=89673 RepID=A0A834E115_9CHIR|nr:hypothetical protein HJG60_011680 [Phyllostomus discolor]